MKLYITLSAAIYLCLTSLSFAADNPRCIEEYKKEEARIVHDAESIANTNPQYSDVKAQQQLMMPIHEALKAAAERAEKCNHNSTNSKLHQNQCAERAIQQITDLKKQYAEQSNLSHDEQAVFREEQNRIVDSRMECERKARQ